MPVLREQITTSLPIGEAFTFIANFANSMLWDPGVASSRRIDDGPLGVGARYLLQVRMRGGVVPMEYVVTAFDPPNRVVLAGSGSSVSAVDEIRFDSTRGGTRIDYIADIRLRGLLRLLEPFAGGAFEKIGRAARDGMERALAQRAAASTDAAAAVAAADAAVIDARPTDTDAAAAIAAADAAVIATPAARTPAGSGIAR